MFITPVSLHRYNSFIVQLTIHIEYATLLRNQLNGGEFFCKSNQPLSYTRIPQYFLWNKSYRFLDIVHRRVPKLENTTFRRLDSVPVFMWNLLSWAQQIELRSVSGHHQVKVTLQLAVSQSVCLGVEPRLELTVLDIIHRPAFYLKTYFGDRILSPSSSGTYSDGSNRKIYSLPSDTRNDTNNVLKSNTSQTTNES
jgi:hypothetical protein